MTANTTNTGALALRFLDNRTPSMGVPKQADAFADCEALVAKLSEVTRLAEGLAAGLDEAVKGHDAREAGEGYRPPTGPWRAALRAWNERAK